MPHFQTYLGALILCLALISVAGRDNKGNTAAPEAGTEAQAIVKRFAAGDIRGELVVFPEERPISAGGAVFAQIKLSTDATRGGNMAADLLIEAERGEIGAITGASGEVQDNGQAVRATVEGLRKGRDRMLQVEVKLPRMRSGRTSLKVTLNSPANARQAFTLASFQEATAEVFWDVRDCAGSYSNALRQIRDNPQWRPLERWRDASTPDPDLPRSWLFTPADPRSRLAVGLAEPETTGASPGRSEREVFAEADKLVRARKDPALDREGTLGWTLGKVAGDLETYLSQPSSPAVCAGAPGLVSYYRGRLEGLAQRGRQLTRLAANAKRLARWKVEVAFRAARELQRNRLRWGGGITPVTMKTRTVRSETLAGLTASLAELAAVPQPALSRIENAPSAYDALIRVAEVGLEREGVPYAIRDQVRAAFVALDAAARLELASQRHAALQSAFEGRLRAIRDAYAAHCVCQS